MKINSRNIELLKNTEFDLLIIGGGINGAGVARDAVARGLKVALVEAQDYASGTSSRSSKLIHGGIRYLENMEFHLVYEALSERAKLFKMAPHLVHPLRFLIPVFSNSRVGYRMMQMGMWLYDALAFLEVPEAHEALSTPEIISDYPLIKAEQLVGGLRYSDAYMDDDRLVFETLRSAQTLGQFVCASYVKAIACKADHSSNLNTVTVQDQLDLQNQFEIQARHIVSTVGPWTDDLRKLVDEESKPCLRPTKGIHLTLERSRLPLVSAVVMGVEDRIIFAIPRHDMVIVGTTDTDYKGDPRNVTASAEDVAYLLSAVNQYFPQAKLEVNDILAVYAGVRPLVQDGSANEGKTSREHTIWTEGNVMTFVAGGKYTTYRLIAEQAMDHVMGYFSVADQVKFKKGQTDGPLNPKVTDDFLIFKKQLAEDLKNVSPELSFEQCQKLIDRFGPEALSFSTLFGARSYIQYEALYAIRFTYCFKLVDFYFRRVPLFLGERDHGLSVLTEIKEVWIAELQLSIEEWEQQVQELKAQIQTEMAWKNNIRD